MKNYAVVTTHNRQASCSRLVTQLAEQGAEVVVIDNASSPRFRWPLATVIYIPDQPPNLSRLWNHGLHAVNFLQGVKHGMPNEEYTVSVFNDDVSIPDGYIQKMSAAIDLYEVDAAFPDQWNWRNDLVDTSPPGPAVDLAKRMTGFAFTLRGSAQIYADERLKWWYGDNDIEMKARRGRGTVMVGGVSVSHADPNGWTNRRVELQEQAGKDRATFREIWGFDAW